jgi:O-antigen ligase
MSHSILNWRLKTIVNNADRNGLRLKSRSRREGVSYVLVGISILFIVLSFASKYVLLLYPAIVLVLTILNLEWGLSFIILTCGGQFAAQYSQDIGIFNPNALQVLGMIIFCVIGLIRQRDIRLTKSTLVFGILVVYALISIILWSPNRFEAIKMFGKFLVMLSLLVLFSNRTFSLKKLIKLISISGLISLLVFNPIYYWLLDHMIVSEAIGRSRLVGGGFISTAYALFMGICFIASLLVYEYEKDKRYLILSGCFFLYAVLTYTRIVWIALFIIGTIYLIYKKAWITLGLAYLLIFVVLLSTLSGYFLLTDMNQKVDQSEIDKFTQGRSTLWTTFYHEYQKHPIRGLGFEYTTVYSTEETGIFSLHSDPLRLLFDLGIIGLFLYLIFILLQMYNFLHLRGQYFLLTLFLVFYLICSFTGNLFNYIQLIGFHVFALIGITMNPISMRGTL